jgi:hypothetical protein
MSTFEYDFFSSRKEYGDEIAKKYGAYREGNPLPENATLSQRLDHTRRFCESEGLPEKTVLELEEAREDKRMQALRRAVATQIIVRGGSVPMSDSTRRSIEAKIKHARTSRPSR